MRGCHCCGERELAWEVKADPKPQRWCLSCGNALLATLKRSQERRQEIDLPSNWVPRWMRRL